MDKTTLDARYRDLQKVERNFRTLLHMDVLMPRRSWITESGEDRLA
jgi:hypothetical protein